jgi:hypothetical protein
LPLCPAGKESDFTVGKNSYWQQIASLRPNVPLQRMVDNFPAACPFAENGCVDRCVSFAFLYFRFHFDKCNRITKGIFDDHKLKCGYELVECEAYRDYASRGALEIPQCGNVLRKDLNKHQTIECPFRLLFICMQSFQLTSISGVLYVDVGFRLYAVTWRIIYHV